MRDVFNATHSLRAAPADAHTSHAGASADPVAAVFAAAASGQQSMPAEGLYEGLRRAGFMPAVGQEVLRVVAELHAEDGHALRLDELRALVDGGVVVLDPQARSAMLDEHVGRFAQWIAGVFGEHRQLGAAQLAQALAAHGHPLASPDQALAHLVDVYGDGTLSAAQLARMLHRGALALGDRQAVVEVPAEAEAFASFILAKGAGSGPALGSPPRDVADALREGLATLGYQLSARPRHLLTLLRKYGLHGSTGFTLSPGQLARALEDRTLRFAGHQAEVAVHEGSGLVPRLYAGRTAQDDALGAQDLAQALEASDVEADPGDLEELVALFSSDGRGLARRELELLFDSGTLQRHGQRLQVHMTHDYLAALARGVLNAGGGPGADSVDADELARGFASLLRMTMGVSADEWRHLLRMHGNAGTGRLTLAGLLAALHDGALVFDRGVLRFGDQVRLLAQQLFRSSPGPALTAAELARAFASLRSLVRPDEWKGIVLAFGTDGALDEDGLVQALRAGALLVEEDVDGQRTVRFNATALPARTVALLAPDAGLEFAALERLSDKELARAFARLLAVAAGRPPRSAPEEATARERILMHAFLQLEPPWRRAWLAAARRSRRVLGQAFLHPGNEAEAPEDPLPWLIDDSSFEHGSFVAVDPHGQLSMVELVVMADRVHATLCELDAPRICIGEVVRAGPPGAGGEPSSGDGDALCMVVPSDAHPPGSPVCVPVTPVAGQDGQQVRRLLRRLQEVSYSQQNLERLNLLTATLGQRARRAPDGPAPGAGLLARGTPVVVVTGGSTNWTQLVPAMLQRLVDANWLEPALGAQLSGPWTEAVAALPANGVDEVNHLVGQALLELFRPAHDDDMPTARLLTAGTPPLPSIGESDLHELVQRLANELTPLLAAAHSAAAQATEGRAAPEAADGPAPSPLARVVRDDLLPRLELMALSSSQAAPPGGSDEAPDAATAWYGQEQWRVLGGVGAAIAAAAALSAGVSAPSPANAPSPVSAGS